MTNKEASISISIYELLLKAGIPLDHHESDLYVMVTPESTAIISNYEFKSNVRTFTSKLDKKAWYDIPFAFMPYWESKSPKISLTCACCAGEAIGRQWYNRDTGYGLCSNCVDFVKSRETPESMKSAYGIEGIHYFKKGVDHEHRRSD